MSAEELAQPRPAPRARFHALQVSRIDRLTDDAVAITFAVPESVADAFAFVPGQHVTVRCLAAGDDARRTYSLCARPGELTIGVKRVPGGIFSRHALETLRVGDDIEVTIPAGHFVSALDPNIASHRAAIVAGSGITPVFAIIAATLALEPASRFTLIYANRSTQSVMFLDELADLKDRYPDRFSIVHVLSREPRESPLLTGRLDRAKIGALLDSVVDVTTVDEWFLCGPSEVVDAAKAVLRERGVPDDVLRFELFHLVAAVEAAPSPNDTTDTSATIILAGRTTTVNVPAGVDVLHAVMAVRPDVPYGCTNGMCGTCRAKLVEGSVDMHHCFALDQAELDAGFVLTCQARPRTQDVVLDYDA